MKEQEKIKVFLVDDDPMFANLVRHSIAGDTTEVFSYPNGEACLDNLKRERPSIVILDYYLNTNNPEAMNGLQVLKKIKNTNPATEVIMLSCQEGVDVAVETLKQGAYDYITKGEHTVGRIRSVILQISRRIRFNNALDQENLRLRKVHLWFFLGVLLLFLLSQVI